MRDLQRGFVGEIQGGEEREEELGKKEHQNGEKDISGTYILKMIRTRNRRRNEYSNKTEESSEHQQQTSSQESK